MQELIEAVNAIGKVFYEGGLFILIGLVLAGLLHEFIPMRLVVSHLGRNSLGSVLRAALWGAPMPLCSCSVLPTAAALKEHGASRPAVTAFLISTPETGVDSVALTYGLMGPVMAVLRVVGALGSAMIAGSLVLFWGGRERAPKLSAAQPACCAQDGAESVRQDSRQESGQGTMPPERQPFSSAAAAPVQKMPVQKMPVQKMDECCETPAKDIRAEHTTQIGWATRFGRAMHYAFGMLLDDIAFWMTVGLVLTGLIGAFIPANFFSQDIPLDGGILPLLVMLAVATPLYICASASTPVAAALIGVGLSPGAALVFLFAGPATNLATMSVVAKLLGARVLILYLLSVVGVALGLGLATDWLFASSIQLSTLASSHSHDGSLIHILKLAGGILFAALLVLSLLRGSFRTALVELREHMQGMRQLAGR
jgi:uncharacterized membrane protein YraQ (UPF0718 family)